MTDTTLDGKLSKILRYLYGNVCQLCGRTTEDVATMHLLGKKSYPELRWNLANVVWSGWNCCHSHHDNATQHKDRVVKSIERLKGKLWREELQCLAHEIGLKHDRETIGQHLDTIFETIKKEGK